MSYVVSHFLKNLVCSIICYKTQAVSLLLSTITLSDHALTVASYAERSLSHSFLLFFKPTRLGAAASGALRFAPIVFFSFYRYRHQAVGRSKALRSTAIWGGVLLQFFDAGLRQSKRSHLPAGVSGSKQILSFL